MGKAQRYKVVLAGGRIHQGPQHRLRQAQAASSALRKILMVLHVCSYYCMLFRHANPRSAAKGIKIYWWQGIGYVARTYLHDLWLIITASNHDGYWAPIHGASKTATKIVISAAPKVRSWSRAVGSHSFADGLLVEKVLITER